MKYAHFLPHFLNAFSPLLKQHFLPSHIKLEDLDGLSEDIKATKKRDALVDE